MRSETTVGVNLSPQLHLVDQLWTKVINVFDTEGTEAGRAAMRREFPDRRKLDALHFGCLGSGGPAFEVLDRLGLLGEWP